MCKAVKNSGRLKIYWLSPREMQRMVAESVACLRLIESIMMLGPRQEKLRFVISLFSLMRGSPSIRL